MITMVVMWLLWSIMYGGIVVDMMVMAAVVVIIDIGDGSGGSADNRFGDFFGGDCGYGVVGWWCWWFW